jgi:hypothetical protein
MEDLCQRIPLVAVMIFKELNNQSLIKSKDASRELSLFMCNERFYWLRIIKNYNKNFLEYQVLWKKVLEKTPVSIIQQIAYAIQSFSCKEPLIFVSTTTQLAHPDVKT